MLACTGRTHRLAQPHLLGNSEDALHEGDERAEGAPRPPRRPSGGLERAAGSVARRAEAAGQSRQFSVGSRTREGESFVARLGLDSCDGGAAARVDDAVAETCKGALLPRHLLRVRLALIRERLEALGVGRRRVAELRRMKLRRTT